MHRMVSSHGKHTCNHTSGIGQNIQIGRNPVAAVEIAMRQHETDAFVCTPHTKITFKDTAGNTRS